jgi:DNA-binding LytR/AlgR family response regulator
MYNANFYKKGVMNKVTFVIIEENKVLAMSTSNFLSKHNFKILKVSDDIDDALLFCKINQPNIIILNNVIKGEQVGIRFSEGMKKYNIQSKLLLVSENSDPKSVNNALQAKPDLFLTIPFNKHVLLTNLEILIDRFKLRGPSKIVVKQDKKRVPINFKDIVFIKSKGNYLILHTKNNTDFTIREKMSSFIEKLNPTKFIRIHQRYTVNKDYIAECNMDEIIVSDERFPISKSYKSSVKELYV